MPTTPIYALPYPAAADPADVPLDMQELADRIEAVLGPGGLPGQEFAYLEFTTAISLAIGTDASATPILTAPSRTYDGATPVIAEFFAPWVQTGGAVNSGVRVGLYDGAATLGVMGTLQTGVGASAIVGVLWRRRFTPAAGAHVFAVKGWSTISVGNVTGAAGGSNYVPGYFRIMRA